MVNGKKAELGTKVDETDDVRVNGKKVNSEKEKVYLAFHKPKGVTCTTDLKDPDNIIDYIGYPERIFHIGRLDKPSEGLIFLTNDGDIVNKILRAGNNHEKEYVVTVDKSITDEFIHSMSSGVRILGTLTKKCHVRKDGPNRFIIILTQGMNRQIRRMCEVLGYQVTRLKRTRIMNIKLEGIKPGEWRYLTDAEMEEINAAVKNSVKTEEASLFTNEMDE